MLVAPGCKFRFASKLAYPSRFPLETSIASLRLAYSLRRHAVTKAHFSMMKNQGAAKFFFKIIAFVEKISYIKSKGWFKIVVGNVADNFNSSFVPKLVYLLSFLASLRNDFFNILGN